MKTQCQWWALKLGRVIAVLEGAPEGGTRELGSDEPLFTGPQGPNLKGTTKRAHVVHWAFCHPCWQSRLPPQSSQSAFLFLPPLTPRHLQKPDALGHVLQYCFSLPRKMPWHRAAGGHERKRRRRAAAAGGHSLAVLAEARCQCAGALLAVSLLPATQNAMARAAGGHERKRRRRAAATHLPCSHRNALYFFGPT